MTRKSTCDLLLCRSRSISHKARPKKQRTSAAADCFASYTRCNGDSFLTIKKEKYAFKKLTDCAFKLLTHYTSGHKRTGLAISKRVEGAALSEIVNLGIFPCGLSFRFGSMEFPSCVKTLLN